MLDTCRPELYIAVLSNGNDHLIAWAVFNEHYPYQQAILNRKYSTIGLGESHNSPKSSYRPQAAD